MKFTSEELAKLLGIKIGDKIKYSNGEVADVIEDYQLSFPHSWRMGLHIIIDEEFEILPQKKKLGEKLCKEMVCDNCPLCKITCMYRYYKTLYEVLDNWYERFQDKELYDILKARLDREEE